MVVFLGLFVVGLYQLFSLHLFKAGGYLLAMIVFFNASRMSALLDKDKPAA